MGEVDHCLPFILYLDSISGLQDSSLHLSIHFGCHVKSGKTASAIDSGDIALSLRTPTGSFCWSAPGVTQPPAAVSGHCEVSLGDT